LLDKKNTAVTFKGGIGVCEQLIVDGTRLMRPLDERSQNNDVRKTPIAETSQNEKRKLLISIHLDKLWFNEKYF